MQPDTTGGVTASSARPAHAGINRVSEHSHAKHADIVKHIGAQVQSGKLSLDEAKAIKWEAVANWPYANEQRAMMCKWKRKKTRNVTANHENDKLRGTLKGHV